MSGGWTPSVHLHSQSRGKLVFDDARADLCSRRRRAGASAPPAPATGRFALADVLDEGAAAGAEAARAAGFAAPAARRLIRSAMRRRRPAASSAIKARAASRHARAFVDFQNDL